MKEHLSRMDIYKVKGPDRMHARVLGELAAVFVEVADNLKKGNDTTILKMGKKEDPQKYRPVSLTLCPRKSSLANWMLIQSPLSVHFWTIVT